MSKNKNSPPLIDETQVRHIAHLARLTLDQSDQPGELDTIQDYQRHLEKILHYMDELKTLDTSSVEVFLNPVRETAQAYSPPPGQGQDQCIPPLGQERILGNAPDSQYGQFKVAAIIEQES